MHPSLTHAHIFTLFKSDSYNGALTYEDSQSFNDQIIRTITMTDASLMYWFSLNSYRCIRLCIVSAVFVLSIPACTTEPELHAISGKVTLGGKPYERLIVYFRPQEGEITRFNMGVGETDAQGNLSLRSSAGMGLARGKYRVSFSCYVVKGGQALGIDQKVDEIAGGEKAIPVEMVPRPYVEDTVSGEVSPVEFEIKPGDNAFEYDIPAK